MRTSSIAIKYDCVLVYDSFTVAGIVLIEGWGLLISSNGSGLGESISFVKCQRGLKAMKMMAKAIKDDAAPTPVANCAPKVLAILPAIKLPKGIKPVAIM